MKGLRLLRRAFTVGAALLLAACLDRGTRLQGLSLQSEAPSEASGEDPQPESAFSISETPLTYTQPGTPPMAAMKSRGCMFDGILYAREPLAGQSQNLQMLARSSCFYLPRAVETWNSSPNLRTISSNLAALRTALGGKARQFLFGAFIAESVDTTRTYFSASAGSFNPSSFCYPGSQGTFGSGTCVPDLSQPAYQSYVLGITSDLLDLGISDFLFGQLQFVDRATSAAPALLARMRELAASKGRLIVIGGQTNTIRDGSYLQAFDYILGGSYITTSGELVMDSEVSGPQAQAKSSALLWHPTYRALARNVIIEFDWWNTDDDIHRFARLSADARASSLSRIRSTFSSLNVGFLLPFSTPLNGGVASGSCYGANVWAYSASRDFGCKDETVENILLSGGTPGPSPTASPSPSVSPKPSPSPSPSPSPKPSPSPSPKPSPSPSPSAKPTQLTFTGNRLDLYADQWIETAALQLLQQGDGNLVLYRKSDRAALWSAGISGFNCYQSPCHAIFQGDGNLVIYQGTRALWASNTVGGYRLILRDTAPYLSIESSTGTALWRKP